MKDKMKEEFLEAFKNLEDVLAAKGFTRQANGKGLVAQYEDTLESESDVKKGLQICRINRNGYQHENRTLFLPTKDAIDLLNRVARELDVRVRAKDVAKKNKKYLTTDKLQDVLTEKDLQFLLSGGIIPVLSSPAQGYMGAIDAGVALKILSSGKKVQLKSFLADEKIRTDMQLVAKSTDVDVFYADLDPETPYYVLDAKGAYKGVIQKFGVK
jgi:hypothetical protein